MRIALFPKIVGAILAAMTLAGCVTDADPTANVSAGDEQAFSEPILFTVDDYRLGAGDRVKITVFGEPDLSGEFAVDGTGYVSLPLVGEIKAAALTVREFQSAVDVAFRDGYLKDPKVSAEVTTYRPYFILGEVKQPGTYAYQSGLTVLNAVATAQGFTYRANERFVFIRRDGAEREEKVSLTSTTPVQPGDTIRIAERFF